MSSTNTHSQWVTFTLDNETYGINVMLIQEVLRYTEIAPVPGSAHYILGIINLRGNVVTVIDGRRKLQLQEIESVENSRIIIIEVGDQVLGLLADSVSEVTEIDDETIEISPASTDDYDDSKYIYGVCQVEDNLLIMLDIEKLFKSELESADSDDIALGF